MPADPFDLDLMAEEVDRLRAADTADDVLVSIHEHLADPGYARSMYRVLTDEIDEVRADRLRVTIERDHLRDLLGHAIEHIDPNDSDEHYRLLLECQAAVDGEELERG